MGWETATGDRGNRRPAGRLPLWTEFPRPPSSASAANARALGLLCHAHARNRRRRAIVIVNHHLLCADASVREGGFGEVIPECDYAVIDEAHQLEDVVTQILGVRSARIASTSSCEHLECNGFDAKKKARSRSRSSMPRTTFTRLPSPVRCRPPRTTATRCGDRAALTPEGIGRLNDVGIGARAAIDRLLSRLKTAKNSRRTENSRRSGRRAQRGSDILLPPTTRPSCIFSRHAAVSRPRGADRCLANHPHQHRGRSRGDHPHVGDARRGGRVRLREVPLIGGGHHAPAPSEFDFRQQAVLFLPSEMPDPRSPEFNRAAAWIIGDISTGRRTGIRAFTSYAAMREYTNSSRLGPAGHCSCRVRARSSLFGTFGDAERRPAGHRSFWQGVDVAGEALSCVIVDRLPFACPDPLVAARLAAIERRGGQPFTNIRCRSRR